MFIYIYNTGFVNYFLRFYGILNKVQPSLWFRLWRRTQTNMEEIMRFKPSAVFFYVENEMMLVQKSVGFHQRSGRVSGSQKHFHGSSNNKSTNGSVWIGTQWAGLHPLHQCDAGDSNRNLGEPEPRGPFPVLEARSSTRLTLRPPPLGQ